ncbi:MAG: sigma 54-interacting transcriptional regulator [Silvanigrellales bacterium]|nr:sigma 54-interacting transcriptional regulator [Silvanigrellales bacterium]
MKRPLRVLHLDDNFAEIKKVRDALRDCAVGVAFDVRSVSSRTEFEGALKEESPDIAIVDVRLSEESGAEGEEGLRIVERLRAQNPGVVVIMCSSLDDVGTVKKSLLAGADDFLSKSCDRAHLSLRVANAYRLATLKRGLDTSQTSQEFESPTSGTPEDVLSKNMPAVAGATLRAIARRIPGILRSAVTAVHVRGESGTGKEVVSDMFSAAAAAAGGVRSPFVKVNCGSIAPSLLESELFGHARGAFTGASAERRGYVEEASGGWLFLDEVALLSPTAQVALLRVLENGEVTRVGETKPRKVQTRILSAANEPLDVLVAEGRFRRDLWQRLQEVVIDLPPLRERIQETPELVELFCRTMAGGPYEITQSALDILCEFPWREGNVRELRNCLRAMTSVQMEKLLTPLSIPERIWNGVGSQAQAEARAQAQVLGTSHPSTLESSHGAFGVAATQPAAGGEPDVKLLGRAPSETQPVSLDALENLLFLECIRAMGERERIPSMRALARALQVSPSTVPRRVQVLLAEGAISREALERYLHIGG